MKRLTVLYDGATLFDGEVAELVWTDSVGGGVKVEGRVQKKAAGGAAGGLLDMLTGVSKAKTQKMEQQKRDEFAAESDVVEVVEPELVEEPSA